MVSTIALAVAAIIATANAGAPTKRHTFKVPQYGCLNGLRLVGKKCIGREQVQMDRVCEQGFTMINGKCVAYSQLNEFCDNGFTRQGNECVRKIPIDLIPECDNDYILNNGRCEKTTHITPTCPPNTIPNGKECSTESELLYKCDMPGYTMRNGVCVKQETVDLVPECNQGVLNYNTQKCELEVVKEQVCPMGTMERNGLCVEERPYKFTCEDGFVLRNDKCVFQETIELTATCDKGFEYVAQRNRCERIEQLEPVCPHGSMNHNGQCVKLASVLRRCPEGFQRRGHGESMTCEHIRNVELEPRCDHDERLVGHNVCEKLIPQEPICPPSTTTVGDSCETTTMPKRQCENSSYKLVGDQCVSAEFDELIPNCMERYYLENNVCVKQIENTPICPRSYHESNDGYDSDRCEKETPVLSKCGAGFLRRGDKCVRFIEEELVAKCTKGMELAANNTCVAKIFGTIQNVCERGQLVGNKCMTENVIQPERICPEDYQLSGNKCVRDIEYDCSETTYTEQCKEDKLRKYHNNLHAHKIPAARMQCTNLPVVTPKTCTKKVFADVLTECPRNTEFKNNRCIERIYSPSSEICLDGESVQNCFRIKQKPARMVCPLGDMNKCGTEQFDDLIHYCENSYELINNRCLSFAGKVYPGGERFKTLTQEPTYSCAPGFMKNSRGGLRKNFQSTNCKRVNHMESTLFCEDYDYMLEGHRCVKRVEKLYREPLRVTRQATMVCPLANATQSSCNVVTNEQPILYCQEAYHLQGDRCVKFYDMVCPNGGDCTKLLTERPTMICPLTGTANTLCQNKIVHPAQKICSEMFTMNVNETACERFENKICPVGGCIDMIQSQPQMVCPLGNASPNACFTTDEQLPSSYCQSGFEMFGNKCLKFFTKSCPNNQCTTLLFQNPRMICPRGESGKGCFDLARADLNVTCGNGSVPCGKGKCCRYSNVLNQCPPGTVSDNGSCFREIETPVQEIEKK